MLELPLSSIWLLAQVAEREGLRANSAGHDTEPRRCIHPSQIAGCPVKSGFLELPDNPLILSGLSRSILGCRFAPEHLHRPLSQIVPQGSSAADPLGNPKFDPAESVRHF